MIRTYKHIIPLALGAFVTSAICESPSINLVCQKISGDIADSITLEVPFSCSEKEICNTTDKHYSITLVTNGDLLSLEVSRYSGMLSVSRCYAGKNLPIHDAMKECVPSIRGQMKCERATQRKF